MEEITEEMFKIWKADPVTKHIFEALKEDVEGLEAFEPDLSQTADKIAIGIAYNKGKKDGINHLLEVHF